jgi:hypothetical protein
MIDPDFDPGEPWCAAMLVGIAIVVLAALLLLRLAQAVDVFGPREILGCSAALEPGQRVDGIRMQPVRLDERRRDAVPRREAREQRPFLLPHGQFMDLVRSNGQGSTVIQCRARRPDRAGVSVGALGR